MLKKCLATSKHNSISHLQPSREVRSKTCRDSSLYKGRFVQGLNLAVAYIACPNWYIYVYKNVRNVSVTL